MQAPFSVEQYAEQLEAFKTHQLFPEITQHEAQHSEFAQWLECLRAHAQEFAYLQEQPAERAQPSLGL